MRKEESEGKRGKKKKWAVKICMPMGFEKGRA